MNPSSHINPARLLFDLNWATKVWFGLFLISTIALVLSLLAQLVPRQKTVERFLVIASDGGAYRAAASSFSSLTNLHIRQAEDATYALLNRNPVDFDQPDRLPLLFQPDAVVLARKLFEADLRERQTKQLHQKAEINRLQFARVGDEQILISVQGQLLQIGVFQGQVISEPLVFKLDLDLIRNPNLALNAAFPLVVRSFHYETHSR